MTQDSLNITSFVRDHAKVKHAATLRQGGLRRDRSQVPVLIQELETVSDDLHLYSTLHSLAQIGDVSALPTIEALIQKPGLDLQGQSFAKVARANLIAEGKAENVSDPQQKASVRLREFLAALGTDAAGINAAVAHDQALPMLHKTVGEGTYAIEGLADMIYRHRDMALADVAKASGIDFDAEPGAKYKIQLAPLSDQERVDWLIKTLSNKQVLTTDDYFLVQLAADEGRLASRAIAARLLEMDQNRAEEDRQGTFSHAGYSILFDVVSCIGDPTQEPVLRRYLNDPDRGVVHYANLNYGNVRDGAPAQMRIGY